MNNLAELLERFRRGGELLSAITLGCAGQEADFKPGEHKWSVRQIVCHLADHELVTAVRLRLVIAQNNPTLSSYDQDAWADHLDYGKRKISHAIEMFRKVRAETYELLKDLPEPAFERTATHLERGTVTLGSIIEGNANHLENHVRQIQAARASYKASKAQTVTAS